MQIFFLAFLSAWIAASAARLRSQSLPFPKEEKRPAAPAGAPAAAAEDDDTDSSSRALEAAIMGLSSDIVAPTQQQKAAHGKEVESAKKQMELNKHQVHPQRQQQQVQPAKTFFKAQTKTRGAQSSNRAVQYPQYYPASGSVVSSPAVPVTTAAPIVASPSVSVTTPEPFAPPAVTTSAPIAEFAVATTLAPSVATSVAPGMATALATTAAPQIDLGTWKVQMEQRLHQGLSSEIKILNTLMTHQTQTHKQLIRFKQVLTVLGQKYKASELLSQQQQAKIASLEQQLAGFSQQVGTLNAKFEAYKKHYDQKWAGSNTAIESLYKKTADALGAMSAVHVGVQQQLQGMTTAAPGLPSSN
eukprot:gnl/MRDRNA2_/MRDRNA2_119961_c0_seq1.p1 gnl/MRDRNA2_/MRDRNA2_119961_c0~~gnl/MRDRNA2_/MRDRNA2_119961_c0_seq1.p1  ORF type:complete len:358 (+),score=88.71 gnl/MRDRNA2_/MRDRNA2_119961_c0_seq1:205-1278(+)